MDSSNQPFRIPIVKKHFLSDSSYQLIQNEKQLLFEQVHSLKPQFQLQTHTFKYTLDISLQSVIFWKLAYRNNSFQLDAVGLKIQNSVKFFYSDHTSLSKLKQLLNQKIFFATITELYQEINYICQGAFGQVSRLKCKLTSKEMACKKVSKHRINSDVHNQIAFFDEIKILTQLCHNKLLHLKELFSDDQYYYIVYEYLSGGTLKQIIYKKALTHTEIITIMKALLTGLTYMHKQGVMHRDIKPDNIMFRDADDLSSIVIIDFGFAQMVGAQSMNLKSCGSPGYIAPEVINNEKHYTAQCDVFSIGAILYEMNTQKKLFEGSSQDEVLFKNKQCSIKHVSNSNFRFEDLRFITQQMLQINPKNRISSQQALNFFSPHDAVHEDDYFIEEENGNEKSIRVQSELFTGKIE